MLFRISTIYIAISFVFLISSCSSLYIPNKLQVVQIEEKGDASLDASIGFNSIDLQSTVALSDQFYLGLSAFGGGTLRTTENWAQRFYQFGIQSGYQWQRDSSANHTFGIDLGWGHTTSSYYNNLGQFLVFSGGTSGEYRKYALQYTYYLKTKVTDLYVSIRTTCIDAYSFRTNLSQPPQSHKKLFLEPVFGLIFGPDKLKFTYQVGYCISAHNDQSPFGGRPFIGSIGLQFRF
ncbi:hypothetical protein [Parvicella tangerina]|uniref:DUF481 domain-containing protein n=1 Tax=Parvicella tangerina TaxID=2829795 RepID=A0A916NU55_9FLAO|nr:hypothetical protein [Parvicella tangerina]CAG5087256.1 hypothetical protein CRYO30217_03432 [Parvicella tangerina]